MGSLLCEHCTALCCRYIALPIDTPQTRRDFDDIRWYLMHDGVTVFVEEGEWYVQFSTRCSNLLPTGRCAVYEQRPAICRQYKAGECDYNGGDYDYDALFTEVSQLEEYAAGYLRKRRARKKSQGLRRRAKPRRAR